jgi:hypothetical protein
MTMPAEVESPMHATAWQDVRVAEASRGDGFFGAGSVEGREGAAASCVETLDGVFFGAASAVRGAATAAACVEIFPAGLFAEGCGDPLPASAMPVTPAKPATSSARTLRAATEATAAATRCRRCWR